MTTKPPLVLVPGIQGRPEYHGPAIDALADRFHVMTLPLCGEPSAAVPDASSDLDAYADLIEAALDAHGCDRAVICGVSFGGIVALRFAARRPHRTEMLVLASVPGPGWHLRGRHEFYARWPRLFGALFLAESPFRLRREIAAALPSLRERRRFLGWQLRTVVAAPPSLLRMAARAKLIAGADMAADCQRVSAPTFVVTGEAGLDQVVAVEATRRYLELIAGAEYAVIEKTGHLGSTTRPDVFASLVEHFVERHLGGVRRASA